MTSADVRTRLTHALRLDVIGPEPNDPQVSEILPIAPSRWYLTGFLVPWNAPAQQKRDEDDTQGELEFGEATAGGDDDDSAPEPRAARRSHFPSSLGVSVLVPRDVAELVVMARWGDYKAIAKDGALTGEWRRSERSECVTVTIRKGRADRSTVVVPNSDGLEIVTSARVVRGLDDLPGLPAGTMAVSVFLVNQRQALEGLDDLKDERFVFQATLTVESDRPFVPRPNPRGQERDDPDERVADLQYRDAAEFAVGHGTSVHSIVASGECRIVRTTWTPQCEVERVEPERIEGVELRMEMLAEVTDAGRLRASIASLVERYRGWIENQATFAPTDPPRSDVAADLLNAARRAAQRIEDGLSLLDDPIVLDAFRLMNRAMAMAARQRRSQETRKDPASVDAPAWRPFQLAFVLMNLRSFVTPTHADRELVDLLFFPTGGGKTEAYLGLAAFVILFRRLRRPGLESAGVAVLMRYTLRLLTLDQLSRAATLICALELIRRADEGQRLGAWPFEIGLWVGRAATPNRMGRKGDNDRRSARAKTIYFQSDTKNRPAPIPLENCPWCGTKFQGFSF